MMTIKKIVGRRETRSKRREWRRGSNSDRENEEGKIYDRKSDKNNIAKIMTTSIQPFFCNF